MKKKPLSFLEDWVDAIEQKSLYQRIENGEFETKLKYLPYPEKPKEPKIDLKMSLSELVGLKNKYENELENYNELYQAYKNQRALVTEDSNRLQDEFKNALEKDCGVVGNPKAYLLYSIAWDRGHSGGLGDVYSLYCELSELIT